MVKLLLSALSLIFMVGCGSGNNELIYKVEVQSHKRVCYSMIQGLCLRGTVLINNEEVNRNFSFIRGFEYRWGTSYDITILEKMIENPPADGPDREYTLISVNSSQEDDQDTQYVFENVMMWEATITNENGEFKFIRQRFICNLGQRCDELVALNSSGGHVNLTFEYRGNGEIELTDWN